MSLSIFNEFNPDKHLLTIEDGQIKIIESFKKQKTQFGNTVVQTDLNLVIQHLKEKYLNANFNIIDDNHLKCLAETIHIHSIKLKNAGDGKENEILILILHHLFHLYHPAPVLDSLLSRFIQKFNISEIEQILKQFDLIDSEREILANIEEDLRFFIVFLDLFEETRSLNLFMDYLNIIDILNPHEFYEIFNKFINGFSNYGKIPTIIGNVNFVIKIFNREHIKNSEIKSILFLLLDIGIFGSFQAHQHDGFKKNLLHNMFSFYLNLHPDLRKNLNEYLLPLLTNRSFEIYYHTQECYFLIREFKNFNFSEMKQIEIKFIVELILRDSNLRKYSETDAETMRQQGTLHINKILQFIHEKIPQNKREEVLLKAIEEYFLPSLSNTEEVIQLLKDSLEKTKGFVL